MDPTQITSRESADGFRISLRITHPTAMPQLISQQVARSPDVEHAVGAPRSTPKGTALPGVYKESFWLLRGPSSDNLQEVLRWANSVTSPCSAFLREVVQTGGAVEYFIGCFVGQQLGGSIDPATLEECGRLGVTITLDIYGPDAPSQ